MNTLRGLFLVAAGIGLLMLITGWLGDLPGLAGWGAMILVVGLAVGAGAIPQLRSYQFTAWIVAAVTVALIRPDLFQQWGGLDLRSKWMVLLVVQLVMFGMGTQMRLADFAGVVRMPWAVFVGVLGQFTIMPLVGFALTRIFHFEPEIAAGVILIGSCSAGLASNVMAYLARANLALSVTMTSVTTMLAPLFTPLWMKVLAGQLVAVDAEAMMMEIVKIVLVPVGAALLHDYLTFAGKTGRKVVFGLAAVGLILLLFLAVGGGRSIESHGSGGVRAWMELLGYVPGAVTAGVTFHTATRVWPNLPRVMPVFSMAGIVYFTTVTTAAGREHLLQVGGWLFLAAVLHNALGYLFGYGLARLCRLDVASARTVAFEVGLQNGGMASGLAGALGKLSTMGLAPAIFSPWMNITGSLLANYWRRRDPAAIRPVRRFG